MNKTDKCKIIECSNELLKNTASPYLQQTLENFIDDYSEYDEDTDLLEIRQVICRICEDEYDISGFGLDEIPHESVFCFSNEEKNEFFDVFLNSFNGSDKEVTVGYTASTETGFHTFDTENIKSAVSKYDFRVY